MISLGEGGVVGPSTMDFYNYFKGEKNPTHIKRWEKCRQLREREKKSYL